MKAEGQVCSVWWVFAVLALVFPLVVTDREGRLDVFHEVLDNYELDEELLILPSEKVTEYLHAVLERISCVHNGSAVAGLENETVLGTCPEHLCLDTAGLIALAGGNSSLGLSEGQFRIASMAALQFLSKGKHPCNATLNPGAGALTAASIRDSFVSNISGGRGDGGKLTVGDLERFLHSLEDVYEGIEHDHDDHDDDHDGDHHDDHDGHDEDHDDDHDEDHDDDHDEDHDDHHDVHEGDEDHHDDDDEKEEDHDDDDSHDHDDDHDNEHEDDEVSIVEAKCLSPDALLYFLHADDQPDVSSAEDNIDRLATVTLYLMSRASAIEETCRLYRTPGSFPQGLIRSFTGADGNLTQVGLGELLKALDIVPTTEGGEGDHDEHAGHDHRRRRRSIMGRRGSSSDRTSEVTVSRVKRQASVGTDTKCYSQAELSAIFDLGASITAAELVRLSPALVYQKLHGQCLTPGEDHEEEESPHKWGYGMLTVLIVCLCSLLGVILVPCMNSTFYRLSMALFMGLAVGSLTGDAVLHLIPVTMGAHEHEHGHDHATGPIVVEDFVWFSLVILAGIYGFYLIEAVFNRFYRRQGSGGVSHGHSHDLELSYRPESNMTTPSKEGDDTTDPETHKGNMSLTLMIVLGDAVHNFADGLAIGASFSSGTSVGIATGIAVFWHELPHELGDFAVLLKNGLTVGWALFWNVVSSLTAILGLCISLAVATDPRVQTWIFAVSAGMFLYIAMTDLLPQMTSPENVQDTKVFVLNNVGILLGLGIMLTIAIFEERIVID